MICVDHPRLRGEYAILPNSMVCPIGSSPPARGIPGQRDYTTESRRIIPACAGNTQCKLNCSCNSWDHPRLRGEYSQRACYHSSRQGSSPPARGILSSPHLVKVVLGIIPACAGNTCSSDHPCVRCWDHPRLRGEYTKKSLIFFNLPFLL